ncbi:zinc-dependent metalloprotease [Glaciecola siphonariae]|uniref:Zinc-dependent metalloprotease n=1 Tax=Glaciecola siphonariae TaxID=521012 RepID=A0ABV9LUD7_9ALTE
MSQGDFYFKKSSPFDDWVINYGYSQLLNDQEQEQARLNIMRASDADCAPTLT